MTEQQTAEATEDLTEGLTDDLTHIYSKDRDNRLTKREMAIPSVAEVESYMATCVIPDGYVCYIDLLKGLWSGVNPPHEAVQPARS